MGKTIKRQHAAPPSWLSLSEAVRPPWMIRTRSMYFVILVAAFVVFSALVAIVVLVMYIKPLIGREIPSYEFEPSSELPENFSLESDSLAPFAAGFSYPSGHASRATALAFIAGYAIYNKSKKMGYAIWAFPVIIGITRIYVMQHYPTDIIAGFMFGGLVSVVLSNAMKLDEPFFLSRIKGKEDRAL